MREILCMCVCVCVCMQCVCERGEIGLRCVGQHITTLNLQKGLSGVKSTPCGSLCPSTLAIPFPTPLQACRTLNLVTTWSRSSSKIAGALTALTMVSMRWLRCCCCCRAERLVPWPVSPPRPASREREREITDFAHRMGEGEQARERECVCVC